MTADNVFDRLVPLRDDPEAFEAERLRIIEQAISEFPAEKQRKARQIQWTIDARLQAHHGTGRYIEMQKMFWRGVGEFQDALDRA